MHFGAFADAADGSLDVNTIVTQMDQTVWALRSTWEQISSKWVVMASSQAAQAADARLASLRTLINDLDVGGVAREHVFFPLSGQTSDAAWATYRETADYVRSGLADLGGFISTWALAPTLARVGKDLRDTFTTAGTIGAALGAAVLVVLLMRR